MANWKTVLTSNQEVLGIVDIKRGIIQGDSLSPLLFVIIMIPLSLILRDTRNKIESLVQTVWSYSEDIRIKCAVLELERGRLVKSEGVELPDGERMKEVDQEGYKYFGVLQLEKIMNNEMKENIGNEYTSRVKLICKLKKEKGCKNEDLS